MLLIFLSGVAAGALVSFRVTKTVVVEKTAIESMNRDIMDLLEEKLSLRPEQVVEIQSLVDQACGELEVIKGEGEARVEAVIRKYHELIAAEVDSSQLPILKEMERKRRQGEDFVL